MYTLKRFFITLFIMIWAAGPVWAAAKDSPIPWRDWSDELFAEAQREQRFVLLDLEAVWCHWCHVMDAKTYRDPRVVKLIRERFIAVKVDQDSRPDLSRRYQDYGWPATIFFAADGTEIVKRAGYIAPDNMARLLQAIIDDPSPEEPKARELSFAASPLLSDDLRATLVKRHVDSYDPKYGGLKLAQKFLDRDSVEYGMLQARRGDAQNTKIARHTLDAATALIDPAWGGVYQYSTGGKWDYPHFEKIMNSQASYLRIYALAYAQWREPRYLQAALDIRRYLRDFLTSPEGAFYTSQDADLVQGQHSHDFFALDNAQRRARGIPRVDKNRYARENGWAIEALATLYAASGDRAHLDAALRAANWIIEHRSLPGGGFRHGAQDPAGPYLGDNLAMGRAFLALYGATGDRTWLQRTEQALQFIDARFRHQSGGKDAAGYATAASTPQTVIKPQPQIDENIALARYAVLVQHYTGNPAYRAIAERVMRYLATPAIATSRLTEAGILLVDHELANDPTHITIVGHKDDPAAQALFREAIRYEGAYKRVEWWDKREGKLPNPDVQYPTLKRAAAFVCSNQRCSLPVFTPKGLHTLIDQIEGIERPAQVAEAAP